MFRLLRALRRNSPSNSFWPPSNCLPAAPLSREGSTVSRKDRWGGRGARQPHGTYRTASRARKPARGVRRYSGISATRCVAHIPASQPSNSRYLDEKGPDFRSKI